MPRPSAVPSADKQQCAEYAQFANGSPDETLAKLGTSLGGLSEREAERRLLEQGHNELAKPKRYNVLAQFLLKFANPLVIVLLVIAASSLLFGDAISALLVLSMAVLSVFLSFFQEYRAGQEAEKLSEMVKAVCTVKRGNAARDIPMRNLVTGDLVELLAGDLIPADLRVVSSKDLFVNQSSLTGESFPVEKFPEAVPVHDCAVEHLLNIAFMGSSVVSGTAQAVVIRTGVHTQFGEISKRLAEASVESSFDAGIRRLTWMMIRAMAVLIAVIFLLNALLKGNVLEALLFSLAVAVGLTPEMLPMVVAMNLSKGAIAMSRKKVIVKHLNSLQNFGAMDVLCTDKTGTLTMDKIVLERYCDVRGQQDETVLRYAYLNSYFQTGLKGLLDRTILDHEHKKMVHPKAKKVDEIPFDFERKLLSVVVTMEDGHRLIAKGAPEEIFKRCTHYKLKGKVHRIRKDHLQFLEEEYDKLSAEGFRVLAVAYKEEKSSKKVYSKEDEQGLILRGYLAFLDPPKPTSRETIRSLNALGIEVKVLTGDNALVTKKICAEVGLDVRGLVTGDQLAKMKDAQVRKIVRTTTVFARLSPFQKEQVIRAIRWNKHVVGYLGDGINDAPALKAADVGISVNNAVDVAKESADLILLQKNLTALRDGVVVGRRTFGNIVKYIQMGTSSSLGNMISMTGASFLLPFIPMLPIQILLNNFLYDLSQLAIPTDNVDAEYVSLPRRWDIASLKRFMIVFGVLSSLFDFLAFGVFIKVFHADAVQFHTAWFLESLVTQALVIHVIRTRKIPFLQSRPSGWLLLASLAVCVAAFAIPLTQLAGAFGFTALSSAYYAAIGLILIGYLIAVQAVKAVFARRGGYA
jgi:Mg2+-importing ATPase